MRPFLFASVALSSCLALGELSAQSTGVVAGVVRTQAGVAIPGAQLLVNGKAQGVADEKGEYRISLRVDDGYLISARKLGYETLTKNVSIKGGQLVRVEFVLHESIGVLDQVVVAGTIAPTKQRAVSNQVTVITASDIRERGIALMEEAISLAPGVFVLNRGAGSRDGSTAMFSRGGDNFLGAASKPMKTYVDGVEVASPEYLNTIDMNSVERIEILPGPQASTIYGSEALNGVIQIFTKRGLASGVVFDAEWLSGVIANSYNSSLSPEHRGSVNISGGLGKASYSVGGDWGYQGQWTPGRQTRRKGVFGGLNVQAQPFQIDISGRVSRQGIDGLSYLGSILGYQGYYEKMAAGEYAYLNSASIRAYGLSSVNTQTVSGSVAHRPFSFLLHQLTVGIDQSNAQNFANSTFRTPVDSFSSMQSGLSRKGTISYNLTLSLPLGFLSSTSVFGYDESRYENSNFRGDKYRQGTAYTAQELNRSVVANKGVFGQVQLTLGQQLFLTAGVRGQENPNYGDNYGWDYSPRYGISYVEEIGELTTKVRSTYGRSTRAPLPVTRGIIFRTDARYPDNGYYASIANPVLGPEYQSGSEGGFDLYFGSRGSVSATFYNQVVKDLIAGVIIDSTRSLPDPLTGAFTYGRTSQYRNIGDIRNVGWNAQGAIRVARLRLDVSYSNMRSRLLSLRNPNVFSLLTVGQSVLYLPSYTWQSSFTYSLPKTVANISLSVVGPQPAAPTTSSYVLARTRGRLSSDLASVTIPTNLLVQTPLYASLDANFSHQIATEIDGVLNVRNLTNVYSSQAGDVNIPSIGRQVFLGLRLHTRR